MAETITPVIRPADLAKEHFSKGAHYESLDAPISEVLGLTQIGACYTEVPPGKSACPYHVHHCDDEMFIIIEGEGEYRFGNTLYAVKAGDILGAPRGGPEYAHKLRNTGVGPLKYLALSSKSKTEVCEYPDSGKFLVVTNEIASKKFRYVGRLADERDYWEGEL